MMLSQHSFSLQTASQAPLQKKNVANYFFFFIKLTVKGEKAVSDFGDLR